MDELKHHRSRSVIERLKAQFSRHGIPWTDDPKYTAEEFKSFCEKYGISHQTSSPHTIHANGDAQTVKKQQTIIQRCWITVPPPLKSVALSPAHPLMCLQLKSFLFQKHTDKANQLLLLKVSILWVHESKLCFCQGYTSLYLATFAPIQSPVADTTTDTCILWKRLCAITAYLIAQQPNDCNWQ